MWTKTEIFRFEKTGGNAVRRLRCLLLAAAAALVLLTSCGRESPVWTRYCPAGQTPVYGVGASGFTVADRMLTFKEVESSEDLKNPSGSYILQEPGLVAFIEKGGQNISEWQLTGAYTTVREMLPEIEKLAHIRITGLADYASGELKGRGMSKTVFSCTAEGLYNAVFYGDYSGYLAVIKKDDTYTCLFAGSEGPYGEQLLDSVRTLWYRNYEIPGATYGAETIIKDAKPGTVLPGEKGLAEIWGRTGDGTIAVPVGVALTEATNKRPQKASGASYSDKTIADEESMAYAIFALDTGTHGPTKTFPHITVRVRVEGGAWMTTACIYEDAESLVVAFPGSAGDDIELMVGNKGLTMETRIKGA